MDKALKTKSAPPARNFSVLINQFFLPLMVVMALLIVLAGYFLVIKDSYSRLVLSQKSRLEPLVQLRDALQIQKDYLKDSTKAVLTFTAAEERLVNLALPDEFDLASALIQLQGLAKNSGFVISALSAEEAKPLPAAENGRTIKTNLDNSRVRKINLQLELMGNGYDAFRKLLSSLESSIMFFDVAAVEMGKDSTAYRFKLATYYSL